MYRLSDSTDAREKWNWFWFWWLLLTQAHLIEFVRLREMPMFSWMHCMFWRTDMMEVIRSLACSFKN